MKNQKFYVLLLLILFSSIVLCACSGDRKKGEDPEDGIASSDNGTQGNTPNTSETRKTGGSVIVGITQDLDSLDPHKAVAAGTNEVLFNIFEGLVKSDQDGNLVPAVAESYHMSEDGMQYVFTLREGITFHNGMPVTAEDVIYSLKRYAGLLEVSDPGIKVESALSCIADITAAKTDAGIEEVTISLKESNTELIGYLTGAIIPKDYKNQAAEPVGTGPFRFVSYTPLQKLVMERNKDYYLPNVPYLDQVTFKISADTDAAFFELLAGAIDIFPYLTEEQADQLTELYKIESAPMNMVQALFLNNNAKPFDNPIVRQAVCYAADRQQIIDLVGGGRGTVIGTNMFPGFGKYYNKELDQYYEHNIEKAKELLAQAGYPDGFSFTIKVPSNYQYHVHTAQVLIEQLKQVGIKAEIQLIEWGTWLSDVYKGRDYQATIVGLDSNLAPSDVLKRFCSDASNNFVNFVNTEYDLLYAEAISTIDDAVKIKNYKRMQQILTENAASVYIQAPALMVAVNKKLSGYTFYPLYVQDMSTVYFKK